MRRRGHRQPVRVGLGDPAIDLHERGALAVDRDLHLNVANGPAEEQPGRLAVQQQLELVLAVGREVVRDDRAAARAERRALDAILLRLRSRHVVRRRGRIGRRIADRDAAHVRRRAHVALHHRRRRRLHVGDVVEAGADRVSRQIGADVDVESEERPDRGRVFGAVEPLEHAASGIRLRRGRGVEPRFERRDDRQARRGRRLQRAFLRHQAGAQLADHLLAELRVLADFRDVELLERQLAFLREVVVTLEAVFFEECPGVGCRAGRTGHLLARCGRDAGRKGVRRGASCRMTGQAGSKRHRGAQHRRDEKGQGKPSHWSHGYRIKVTPPSAQFTRTIDQSIEWKC